ncbi:MAG: DUF2141 domain-containing protein [Bacteroidia bacterium]|nr:DUF2141 domain-containing protein [Bacteroidia bacterium]
MNRLIVFCFGLVFISNCSFSQLKLDIELVEISNNTGKIMLQLFDENEKVVTQEMSTIKDKTCSFSITNLKPGKYAVRYYHDENLNGRMERNMFGKPTEGYGFSNNVTGKFCPPPFEKWLFELKEDKKIMLKPMY